MEAFSSNSEMVLQRSVDVSLRKSGSRPEDLHELYQIHETCSFITSNDFKKVSFDLAGEKIAVFRVLFVNQMHPNTSFIVPVNQHILLLNAGSFAVS